MWTASELNNYNLIVCSDSKSCELTYGSALFNAYKNSGKAFLEIPYNGNANAAEIFGYVHSKLSKQSAYGIVSQAADIIFSGFSGYMELANERSSVFGPAPASLNPAITLAKATEGDVATMFAYDAAGSRGRYAYVGWVSDASLLNENGEKLLTRTIDWLVCGSSCLPSFTSTFGDLSLSFEVKSPLNQTYNTKKIYLDVAASQRVKEISMATNDGKPSRVCRDCSAVYKRLSVKSGANKIKISLLDYTGKTTSKTIYFFVNA